MHTVKLDYLGILAHLRWCIVYDLTLSIFISLAPHWG